MFDKAEELKNATYNQNQTRESKRGNFGRRRCYQPRRLRQVTVENAVVDTGATHLSLSKRSLRNKLGLTPVGSRKARTTNGTVDRIIYSAVQFTVLEQQGAILVTALPGHLSVLVGHMCWKSLIFVWTSEKG